MSSEVIPVAIERTKNEEIQIRWSDSSVSVWTASELRKACPCATCKEKKKGQDHQQSVSVLQVIPLNEAQPLRVDGMQPVGNYAYNVRFSDGHSSGIFGFDLLKKSSEK
ncbi:MAG: DUF971 domain-containing protein [Pirellula sp.]